MQYRIFISGRVQGVGFRPFVYRLARELDIAGCVRNGANGVAIDAEADDACIDDFTRRLAAEAPAAARVDALAVRPLAAHDSHRQLRRPFEIVPSEERVTQPTLAADGAVCEACLAELFDPHDRRYRYGLISCTHCGPRYTIATGLPFDRERTTLSAFPLCIACEREYTEPGDRRFHAQSMACPACGPRVVWRDATGEPQPSRDPYVAAWRTLEHGGVIAMKGLGGYHLACDALNPRAVARLREYKAREAKPFALLAPNRASAARFVDISARAAAWLTAPERPIVLMPKRTEAREQLEAAAPGLAHVGIMLPATGLQWLTLLEAANHDAAALREAALPMLWVMTSANRRDEPVIIDDALALRELGEWVDGFLTHDRPIAARCDDSVVSAGEADAGQHGVLIRRARGFVPEPLPMPIDGPAVLALGAQLKNTVCLASGRNAWLSPHVGDLDHPEARRASIDAMELLLANIDARPAWVACDLHPDFFGNDFAASLARRFGARVIAVQHHHAHLAAVAAERGLEGAVLGLALDGFGYGLDGKAWGGELLRLDGASVTRVGHLAPLTLPGGDRASREPWRIAASWLANRGRAEEARARFAQLGAHRLEPLLARGQSVPSTTAAGRWFDLAAALLGLCATQRFEAHAPMLLETAALQAQNTIDTRGGFAIVKGSEGWQLDLSPLLDTFDPTRAVAPQALAFHRVLAQGLTELTHRAIEDGCARGLSPPTQIVAAGGCLLNQVLSFELHHALRVRGLELVLPEKLPPNDAAICYGQAWVARQSAKEN